MSTVFFISVSAGQRMWKILSFTVAIPSVIVCYINAEMKEKEEHERIKVEGVAPFIAYPHLRSRTKASIAQALFTVVNLCFFLGNAPPSDANNVGLRGTTFFVMLIRVYPHCVM